MINPQIKTSKDCRIPLADNSPSDGPHVSNQAGEATATSAATVRIVDDSHDEPLPRRRAAWRQTLVQAERGLVGGFRSGSALFVHFFGISIVIAAALVLGIDWTHWIGIAGCLTLVLTAEMFNQALKALACASDLHSTPQGQRALAIGTAAVVVSCAGSTIILTLIFWQRCQQMFAG
jgi:diacylglycerol kinase